LTKPVESSHLEKFYKRVMPGGWWGPFTKAAGVHETSASSCWIGWVISVITIYLGLFGSGYLCLAKYKMAAVCGVLFAIGTYFSVKEISKISATIKETVKNPDKVKV
jgi:hypothetical protein